MTIIISAVAMIFQQTTDTVAVGTARNQVYQNATWAMDRVTYDFYGMVNLNSGSQRLVMENGKIAGTVMSVGPSVAGGHYPKWPGGAYEGACDLVSMRTISLAGNTRGLYQVTWFLDLDPDVDRQKTALTNRPMYVLKRMVSIPTAAQGVLDNWTGQAKNASGTLMTPYQSGKPVGASGASYTGVVEDVCRYVLHFNVEYMDNSLSFSQLQPSPCTSAMTGAASEGNNPYGPLGNGLGENDVGGSPGTPFRIPYLRVTMVLIDDAAERCERTVTRTISIPMG
jgi:hypothetical protein